MEPFHSGERWRGKGKGFPKCATSLVPPSLAGGEVEIKFAVCYKLFLVHRKLTPKPGHTIVPATAF